MLPTSCSRLSITGAAAGPIVPTPCIHAHAQRGLLWYVYIVCSIVRQQCKYSYMRIQCVYTTAGPYMLTNSLDSYSQYILNEWIYIPVLILVCILAFGLGIVFGVLWAIVV